MAVAWCSGFCRYLGIKFLLFLWLIWPWGTPHYSQFALITKHRKWRGDSASGCVIYFWNLKFPRQVWKEIGFAGKSVSPIPVCDTQTFSHPSISKSGNRQSVFLHCVSLFNNIPGISLVLSWVFSLGTFVWRQTIAGQLNLRDGGLT